MWTCWPANVQGMALVRVDEDLQPGETGGAGGGQAGVGRACLRVREDCQNIIVRPRAVVNTICDRLRARRGTRSTSSGSVGRSVAGT